MELGLGHVLYFLLFSVLNFELWNVLCRKGEQTGFFPSMFLQKAGKKERYEAERLKVQGQKPPPRRYVGDDTVKTSQSNTIASLCTSGINVTFTLVTCTIIKKNNL